MPRQPHAHADGHLHALANAQPLPRPPLHARVAGGLAAVPLEHPGLALLLQDEVKRKVVHLRE